MVYVRGNRANYDSWAAEGNTGWSADEVNTVYKRMEDWVDGEDDYRGAGGPIKVTRHSVPVEPSSQFVQATADTLGVKVLQDYNAESQEGASMMQQNAAGGLRYSASRGYIHGRALPVAQPPDRGARRQGRHRERPRHRRPGDRQGRLAAHHPRRQGGHPLRRRVRLAAAPDAVRHRPRRPPRPARHPGPGRPAGRRQHARPPVRAADLPRADREAPRHAVALRPRAGQGGHASATRSSRTRSSSPSPSCVRRRRPTYPTCRSTCCRGPTRRPTRTRRSGTRSTRGPASRCCRR